MKLSFAICFLLPVIAWSFVRDMHLPSLVRLKAHNTQLSAFNGRTLTVPEHINAKMFAQVGINHTHVPPVGKFRLDATIPAAIMQKNLDDYIQEALRQTKGRALYNGWRNGVIPPYAMKDIVNVLVSFLLEPMIGELCHANNLEVRIAYCDALLEVLQLTNATHNLLHSLVMWRK